MKLGVILRPVKHRGVCVCVYDVPAETQRIKISGAQMSPVRLARLTFCVCHL